MVRKPSLLRKAGEQRSAEDAARTFCQGVILAREELGQERGLGDWVVGCAFRSSSRGLEKSYRLLE